MAEPALVRGLRQGDASMRWGLPVTVKHRDWASTRATTFAFVRDFVGTVAELPVAEVFIVHARNAWLKGLSPKENREIPPLRYDWVHRLKRDFPALTIVLNGGVTSAAQIDEHLQQVDGVMVGRHAYHEPWSMAAWDATFLGATHNPATAASRSTVEDAWVEHLDALHRAGRPWMSAMRHAMGLWNGVPGARRWRQVWSDHRLRDESPRVVQQRAAEAMRQALAETSTG